MLNERPGTAGSKAVTVDRLNIETQAPETGFIAALKRVFKGEAAAMKVSQKTIDTRALSAMFGENVTAISPDFYRESPNDDLYNSSYDDSSIHYDGEDASGDFEAQVMRPDVAGESSDIMGRNDAPDGRALVTGPGVTFNKNGYMLAPAAA